MRRKLIVGLALFSMLGAGIINGQESTNLKVITMSKLANDTRVFAIDPEISVQGVRFKNRFGVELAGHLYLPQNFDASKKYAAIAVCGPFGAVTGESEGQPRYVASPDINTEDFSAAVDFLSLLDFVDPDRVGIIGICGWGGLALNAAAIDTRIKATVTSTMYDMSRVNANGYFDAMDDDARYELKQQLNTQRLEDARNGRYTLAGGVADVLPDDAPWFVKDYHAYYKTKRGYHKRSLNSNSGWNKTSALSFINTPQLAYSDEIRSAVLMIHGEKAHSRYFSEDAFKKLRGDNKELLIIPEATHVDLYDNFGKIPFDKIEQFFHDYLK